MTALYTTAITVVVAVLTNLPCNRNANEQTRCSSFACVSHRLLFFQFHQEAFHTRKMMMTADAALLLVGTPIIWLQEKPNKQFFRSLEEVSSYRLAWEVAEGRWSEKPSTKHQLHIQNLGSKNHPLRK
ncbi:unnamed protein product [Lactuca saligna]|uniref:Secreted protein n=1 Tax=Lactuca saligna TaxID=75948 RepID=A0AA36E0B6_LACSI|nr:unnamed protein product [Lactuca saligna]